MLHIIKRQSGLEPSTLPTPKLICGESTLCVWHLVSACQHWMPTVFVTLKVCRPWTTKCVTVIFRCEGRRLSTFVSEYEQETKESGFDPGSTSVPTDLWRHEGCRTGVSPFSRVSKAPVESITHNKPGVLVWHTIMYAGVSSF